MVRLNFFQKITIWEAFIVDQALRSDIDPNVEENSNEEKIR